MSGAVAVIRMEGWEILKRGHQILVDHNVREGDEEQVECGIGHAAGNTRWEEWEQEVLRGTGSRTHSGWMGSETCVRVRGNEKLACPYLSLK